MSVELRISKVGSIKYLFKYVCEGPDRVTVEIQADQADECSDTVVKEDPTINEIHRLQDAWYVSASEAAL